MEGAAEVMRCEAPWELLAAEFAQPPRSSGGFCTVRQTVGMYTHPH